MSTNLILIIAGWIITAILLVIFIPRNKLREAQVAFFFKQLLTWVLGLAVVELKLIEYPVRLFPYAGRTSFSFEYFIFPAICAIFNVHFPQDKGYARQFMYYFCYCTTITIIEVVVERYTNIINYINWNGFITWITLFITFYITRKYYVWFFKLNKKEM